MSLFHAHALPVRGSRCGIDWDLENRQRIGMSLEVMVLIQEGLQLLVLLPQILSLHPQSFSVQQGGVEALLQPLDPLDLLEPG